MTTELAAMRRTLASPPRWLLDAADGDRVAASLRQHVPELRAGEQLVACRVEDMRLKGPGWSVHYRVSLVDPDTTVSLVGVLRVPGRGDEEVESGSSSRFGSPGWMGHLPDLDVVLRTVTTDSRLPAFAVISDPDTARGLVEQALDAPSHPGIRITRCMPEVVRYKPGNRGTVVHRLAYETDPGDRWPSAVVAKIHRGDEGANAHAALGALRQTDVATEVSIPEPLAYLPDLKVQLQSWLPHDRSLRDLVAANAAAGDAPVPDELTDALHRTADGLAGLHHCGTTPSDEHDWAAELALVRRLAARLDSVFPSVAAVTEPVLQRLEARAGESPATAMVAAHGAFRPAQVLLHGREVGFVDLDGFCRSEAAFDIGRFCSKLRQICLTSVGADDHDGVRSMAFADALAECFLARYNQRAPLSPTRVELWETADLVRSLLQAWTRVQPARIPPLLRLLTSDRLAWL